MFARVAGACTEIEQQVATNGIAEGINNGDEMDSRESERTIVPMKAGNSAVVYPPEGRRASNLQSRRRERCLAHRSEKTS